MAAAHRPPGRNRPEAAGAPHRPSMASARCRPPHRCRNRAGQRRWHCHCRPLPGRAPPAQTCRPAPRRRWLSRVLWSLFCPVSRREPAKARARCPSDLGLLRFAPAFWQNRAVRMNHRLSNSPVLNSVRLGKKPPGADARRFSRSDQARLVGELDVGGLLAAAAAVILDLEGDLVALVEGWHAAPLESGRVHEDVLAAVVGLNEAEAARMIEEFHCAIDTSHREFPFPLKLQKRAIGPRKGVLRRLEMSGKGRALLRRDSHLPSSKSAPKALGARFGKHGRSRGPWQA